MISPRWRPSAVMYSWRRFRKFWQTWMDAITCSLVLSLSSSRVCGRCLKTFPLDIRKEKKSQMLKPGYRAGHSTSLLRVTRYSGNTSFHHWNRSCVGWSIFYGWNFKPLCTILLKDRLGKPKAIACLRATWWLFNSRYCQVDIFRWSYNYPWNRYGTSEFQCLSRTSDCTTRCWSVVERLSACR